MIVDKDNKENNKNEELPESLRKSLDRLALIIKIFGPRMTVTQSHGMDTLREWISKKNLLELERKS